MAGTMKSYLRNYLSYYSGYNHPRTQFEAELAKMPSLANSRNKFIIIFILGNFLFQMILELALLSINISVIRA
jgi:hypothetical protein